jgi:hypothetical protein
MPRTITVDGLFVDDAHHPEDYEGMVLFTDPDDAAADSAATDDTALPPLAERPYPYERCETVRLRGLVTASGKPPLVAPEGAEVAGAVVEVEQL